ncbi:MAG: hypothetical protein ACFFDW_01655 [Candidatus Thorarchaeota archaeon]
MFKSTIDLQKIQIKDFDPLKATAEEWNLYHDYRRRKHLEVNPDDPIDSDESHQKTLQINAQYPEIELCLYNIIDTATNRQIGDAMQVMFKEASPSYEGTKHLVQFDIHINKGYRLSGIGTQVLKKIYQVSKEKGKTMLVSGSFEKDGNAFLEKIGATLALASVENRLHMDEVDWEMVEEWMKEGPIRSPETRLEVFYKIPDELIENYCNLYTEVLNQQPLGVLDVGTIRTTPEMHRNQEKMFQEMGRIWITMITRESKGAISGLTEVRYNPEKKTIVAQLLTGVQEQYRHHGLGKWLKAAMLLKIKNDFPEVKYISTGNANANAPMLSINNRLGFKVHKEQFNAQVSIEKVAEYLDSK